MPNRAARQPLVLSMVLLLLMALAASVSFAFPSRAQDTNTVTSSPDDSLATAQRNADEALSLYWAASAQLLDKDGYRSKALALALEANRIPHPPAQAFQTLKDLAYSPGPQRIIANYPSDLRFSPANWKAVYSPDEKKIAVSNETDRQIYLFDTITGQELQRFEGHQWPINGIAFSPDGSKIVSSSTDTCSSCDYVGSGKELILWDVGSGRKIWFLDEYSLSDHSYKPIFSPDGNEIITLNWSEDRLTERDTASGKEIYHYVGKDNDRLTGKISFNRDGSKFTSGTANGDIIIWDIKTSHERMRFNGQFRNASSVVFSPDGTSILATDGQWLMKLISITSSESIQYFFSAEDVTNAMFNVEGSKIYANTSDGVLIVWDVETGDIVQRIFTKVNIIAIGPSTQTFIVDRGNLVIWDMQPDIVSPDGSNLGVDNLDDLIHWTLANRAVIPLTCEEREYYRVEPYCDAQGTPPVLIPYQTWTPNPSPTATSTPLPPTATPTSNLATQTASLLTATRVTYTHSPTPT
ncbi:MAG: hypothetical protein LCI00_30450 [Chloroflexi bacterium]|nr:hypothetical protein [Chloroflexota bacterium]MCC6894714.1 hypothetical protein [Anaerolineae bacterium]